MQVLYDLVTVISMQKPLRKADKPLGDWEGGFCGKLRVRRPACYWYRNVSWLWRAANAEAGYAAGEVSDHEELVVPEEVFSCAFLCPRQRIFLYGFLNTKHEKQNGKAMAVGGTMAAMLLMGTLSAVTEKVTKAVTEAEEAEEETEVYTGDASMDNVRNQDEIGEKELLVVSFGTSFNDNRRLTVGAIENAIEVAFPEYSVRRGFTSQIIIDHVNRRDGVKIDNVTEALDRAVANGVKTLVVQPTHLMNGLEYADLKNELAEYADSFEKVVLGEPLLTTGEDFTAVATAITDWTKDYDDGETAIVFMGHGTEAESNQVYQKMQDVLAEGGFANYFVGTVEATPSLDDVLAAVGKGEYKRVVLEPLMVVAGDHANNDMAGDGDGAWKKTFEDAGYEVECLVRGLGENEAIQQLYVQHAQAAADQVKERR